jgi:hypothetical protein
MAYYQPVPSSQPVLLGQTNPLCHLTLPIRYILSIRCTWLHDHIHHLSSISILLFLHLASDASCLADLLNTIQVPGMATDGAYTPSLYSAQSPHRFGNYGKSAHATSICLDSDICISPRQRQRSTQNHSTPSSHLATSYPTIFRALPRIARPSTPGPRGFSICALTSRQNAADRGIAERNTLYPPGRALSRLLDASILRRIQWLRDGSARLLEDATGP